MRTLRTGLVVLVAASLTGVSYVADADTATIAPVRHTFASSRANQFRVDLTATRTSGGGMPSATITIAAYRWQEGAWRPLGRPLLVGQRNGFFWKVVTGPRATRGFTLSSDSERVSFRLQVSPSIGWTGTYRYKVSGNRLVRG